MKFHILITLVFATLLTGSVQADDLPKELHKAAGKVYDMLMIKKLEGLTPSEIHFTETIADGDSPFMSEPYVFFRIHFKDGSLQAVKKLSPLLAHAKEIEVCFKEEFDGIGLAPKWPEAAMKKQKGLRLWWEQRRSKVRTARAKLLTMECVIDEENGVWYGFVRKSFPPTNGAFPDIEVVDEPRLLIKPEPAESP